MEKEMQRDWEVKNRDGKREGRKEQAENAKKGRGSKS